MVTIRSVNMLLIGAGLAGVLALGGCATTGSYAQSESNVDYEKFLDSYGDYKLVRRNNDIWMEKLDGSESRQITHTPNTKETGAFFSKDRGYIAFSLDYLDGPFYLVKSDADDKSKKEISKNEYIRIINYDNRFWK